MLRFESIFFGISKGTPKFLKTAPIMKFIAFLRSRWTWFDSRTFNYIWVEMQTKDTSMNVKQSHHDIDYLCKQK
jgi:hypothetical protein